MAKGKFKQWCKNNDQILLKRVNKKNKNNAKLFEEITEGSNKKLEMYCEVCGSLIMVSPKQIIRKYNSIKERIPKPSKEDEQIDINWNEGVKRIPIVRCAQCRQNTEWRFPKKHGRLAEWNNDLYEPYLDNDDYKVYVYTEAGEGEGTRIRDNRTGKDRFLIYGEIPQKCKEVIRFRCKRHGEIIRKRIDYMCLHKDKANKKNTVKFQCCKNAERRAKAAYNTLMTWILVYWSEPILNRRIITSYYDKRGTNPVYIDKWFSGAMLYTYMRDAGSLTQKLLAGPHNTTEKVDIKCSEAQWTQMLFVITCRKHWCTDILKRKCKKCTKEECEEFQRKHRLQDYLNNYAAFYDENQRVEILKMKQDIDELSRISATPDFDENDIMAESAIKIKDMGLKVFGGLIK